MELELPKCKEQISKCNSPGGSPPAGRLRVSKFFDKSFGVPESRIPQVSHLSDVCMNAARTCDNAFIKPVTQSGRSMWVDRYSADSFKGYDLSPVLNEKVSSDRQRKLSFRNSP